ncbi:MAG: hypothetical protein R2857_10735 [Vampirovibrionales bacterium]
MKTDCRHLPVRCRISQGRHPEKPSATVWPADEAKQVFAEHG